MASTFGDDPDERSVQIKKKLGPTRLTILDMKEPYSNDGVALELIQSMIKIEPKERPTAEEVLSHYFFKDYYEPIWSTENQANSNDGDITNNIIQLQGILKLYYLFFLNISMYTKLADF